MILEKIQSSSFLSLTDTPDSYSGKSGMVVAVSSSEGELTFISSSGGGGIPATTVVSETSYGQSSAVGTGSNYARDDHTHGTPTALTGSGIGASYDSFQFRGTDGNNAYYFANKPVASTAFGGDLSLTINYIFAVPFIVPLGGVIDEIRAWAGTYSGIVTTVRLGIYKGTSATKFYPNTLITDCGVKTINTTNVELIWTGLSTTINPSEVYYFALLANWTWDSGTVVNNSSILGYTGILSRPAGVIYKAQAFGVMPATFPAAGTFYVCNPIYFKYHLSS